jgi:hypothetical protein
MERGVTRRSKAEIQIDGEAQYAIELKAPLVVLVAP